MSANNVLIIGIIIMILIIIDIVSINKLLLRIESLLYVNTVINSKEFKDAFNSVQGKNPVRTLYVNINGHDTESETEDED